MFCLIAFQFQDYFAISRLNVPLYHVLWWSVKSHWTTLWVNFWGNSCQCDLRLKNKLSFLTLRKEFAKTDSRFGISGICLSSTPRMDISGSLHSQTRLEPFDPLWGVGSSKMWLSSLVCMLISSGCRALCEHMQKTKNSNSYFFILQLVKNYFEIRLDKIILYWSTRRETQVMRTRGYGQLNVLQTLSFFIPFWRWPVASGMGFETLGPQGW